MHIMQQRPRSKNPALDDYVSRAEFKYLLIYLTQYYDYWTVFSAIDTSKDRKVSLSEFKEYVPTMEKYGVHIDDP